MKKLFVVLAAMLTFTSTAFAALGSLDSDLVYTPVTPCRIFDTRISEGGTGPIAAAGTKNFLIWGQPSYAFQGGAASNCGLTASNFMAAVAVNFTVVSPATPGYITAFPFGTTKPLAATVNFNAGDVRGNFSIAKNAQGFGNGLSIFSTSNVEVIGDVVGYYSMPVATALTCQIVVGPTTIIIAGSTGQNAPASACPANTFYTASYCLTNSFSAILAGFDRSFCKFKNPSASDITVNHDISCCQIAGR